MNKILTLILVLLCSLANSQNSFKISGKLKGFKENALVKIDRENIALDSCYLKDGNFKLKGSLKQSPSLVFLTIKNGEEWVYSSFFIGNENITINAEIKNFPYNVRAEGSKYDDLRYEFITLGKKIEFPKK
nr:DUF4369 domain-containing protein [Riemerella anatipestifer]